MYSASNKFDYRSPFTTITVSTMFGFGAPRRLILFIIITLLLIACPGRGQATNLYSGFDSSTDGWTTVGATAPVFSNNGGNPGGFIYATDSTGNPSFANFGWVFFSPDTWDGDWSNYTNGDIQFDLLPYGYSRSGTCLAILSGADYMYQCVNGSLVDANWTHFQTELTGSNFTTVGASFSQIIGNVTGLFILGDLVNGNERTALDNVLVSAAPVQTHVSQPPIFWMFFSGLGAFLVRYRKKIGNIWVHPVSEVRSVGYAC